MDTENTEETVTTLTEPNTESIPFLKTAKGLGIAGLISGLILGGIIGGVAANTSQGSPSPEKGIHQVDGKPGKGCDRNHDKGEKRKSDSKREHVNPDKDNWVKGKPDKGTRIPSTAPTDEGLRESGATSGGIRTP